MKAEITDHYLIEKDMISNIEPKEKHKRQYFYNFSRRLLDIITASIGLFFSIPIIVFFAIAVRVETPGNPLYVQERVGLHGKVFKIFKLRSMYMNAEINGAQWAKKNDARITNVGHFIRKTRIDELPQLINVLKGDMSLIGPRPERPVFTEEFEKEIPGFKKRLYIKPGVTGWAQVNGGYDITPKEKLLLDLQYIEKQGFKFDLLILLKTVKIMFTGNGAR